MSDVPASHVSKNIGHFAPGQQVDIVLRAVVKTAAGTGRPQLVSIFGTVDQPWVNRYAHELRAVPKPDYDEGDLVVDTSHYIFQKAPVGAEDEVGQKATGNDGFWLVSDDVGNGSTSRNLWLLDNMDFPVTRIPKERLL